MSQIDRQSLKFLFLEGMAIVISILLAFALDAAWEDRVNRQWERAQLEALQEELSGNLLEIDKSLEIHTFYSEQLRNSVIAKLESVELNASVDIRSADITYLIAWYTSDVSTGAISTLLASGMLIEIADDEIRKKIAEWPGMLEDAVEDEKIAQVFSDSIIVPRLIGTGLLPTAIRYHPALADDSLDTESQISVIATTELLDVAYARLHHIQQVEVSLTDFREKTLAILDLLDAYRNDL